jgi:hypothetical protein
MKRFALSSCVALLALASANGQETSRFTADFGGGFTSPVGTTGVIWIVAGTFAGESATNSHPLLAQWPILVSIPSESTRRH